MNWTSSIIGTVVAVAICAAGSNAGAQGSTPSGATSAINLGGRSLTGPEAIRTTSEAGRETVQFSARAGLASDYIYRGTTLSDRRPAVGAGIEASFASLYAGATAASVRLPTNPNAEFTVATGVRPTIGPVDFDVGWTYFSYPGKGLGPETPTIDYWETALRADTRLGESWRAAAGVAYSPNVSNTGAWGRYAAAGLGYELPARLLPFDVTVSFTAGAGYSWFGTQSADLGGFRLPEYLNWQAGLTFTRKIFNLDLRYHDTNLSRENCFVFTGDPNARPGGRVDPVTNPDGLTSNWCGATFVAKAWIALN
jgi:uncharacterized protein (TIGR02001 family)